MKFILLSLFVCNSSFAACEYSRNMGGGDSHDEMLEVEKQGRDRWNYQYIIYKPVVVAGKTYKFTESVMDNGEKRFSFQQVSDKAYNPHMLVNAHKHLYMKEDRISISCE